MTTLPQTTDGGNGRDLVQLTAPEREELAHHEAVIERGRKAFVEVGQSLAYIQEHRLYRESHSTFEKYVRDRWSFGREYGYRLIAAAELVQDLLPIGNIVLPSRESHVRPLMQFPKEQRAKVWQDVLGEFVVGDHDHDYDDDDPADFDDGEECCLITAEGIDHAVRGLLERSDKEPYKSIRETAKAEEREERRVVREQRRLYREQHKQPPQERPQAAAVTHHHAEPATCEEPEPEPAFDAHAACCAIVNMICMEAEDWPAEHLPLLAERLRELAKNIESPAGAQEAAT